MSISADEATAALADLQAAQQRLAAAADCPPARHLAFALIMGTLVSLPAYPIRVTLALELVAFIAIALIVRWDRKRTGMFINGYRLGATRPLTFAMLAVFLVMTLLGMLGMRHDLPWAPAALGVLAVPIAYGFSVQWQKIFHRELSQRA